MDQAQKPPLLGSSAARRAFLATLPSAAGIYLMKDLQGKIFYIGKAKNIGARLRSYVQGSDGRAFVGLLRKLLVEVAVILTASEKEALLLENELIKQHRPRYNVKLRDDKHYPSIKLDLRHPYPRLAVVRQHRADGPQVLYFGPYTSSRALRDTLALIRRYFQLRSCTDKVLESRQRPCLLYHIGRCEGPCIYPAAQATYGAHVQRTIAFLGGKRSALRADLETQMQQHVAQFAFEQAARVRDQIAALEHLWEKQLLIHAADAQAVDAVGLWRSGSQAVVVVMQIRNGRLYDQRVYPLKHVLGSDSDLLADFLRDYYLGEQGLIPSCILLPASFPWLAAQSALLAQKAGHAVRLGVPQRGRMAALVRLAQKNAESNASRTVAVDKARREGLTALQSLLSLSQPPVSIECIDISHWQGKEICASVVHLQSGLPERSRYRRYRIRSLTNQNDPAAIYEVVSRRLQRGAQQGDLPVLLLIDGGKPQLGAALQAQRDVAASFPTAQDPLLVALAKKRTTGKAASALSEQERLYLPGASEPLYPPPHSEALRILTCARDEAHRFALTYQRLRRRQAQRQAQAWPKIPKVGPKRYAQLQKHFSSYPQLQAASLADLQGVVGASLAAWIFAYLHPEAKID